MAYRVGCLGWERHWPDPLRAALMLYEPRSLLVAARLGSAVAADWLAAAWVLEEELSEGRGDSARFSEADETYARIEAEAFLLW